MRERTEEQLFGTDKGVIQVRTVSRTAFKDKQWNLETMKAFRGLPWEPVPGREGIEIRSKVDLPEIRTEPIAVQEPEEKTTIRRRAGITKQDIKKFGIAPGCPGCIAANRGDRRNHTDTCRDRMEALMAQQGDARIDRYAQRVAE